MPAPARLAAELESIARTLSASGPLTSSALAVAAGLSLRQARRWIAKWEREGRFIVRRLPGRPSAA